MTKTLKAAQNHVSILSAYFQFTPDLLKAVRETLARGVRVDIYTNSVTTTDLKMVNLAAYLAMPQWLSYLGPLANQLKLYELDLEKGQGSLHVKGTLIDDTIIEISSLNKDPRNQNHDSNNGIHLVPLHQDGSVDHQVVQQMQAFYVGNEGGLKWKEVDISKSEQIISSLRLQMIEQARTEAMAAEETPEKKQEAAKIAELTASEKFDAMIKALKTKFVSGQI